MTKSKMPRRCFSAVDSALGPAVDFLAVGGHGAMIHVGWEVFEDKLLKFVAETAQD
jgi:hypothetical protein